MPASAARATMEFTEERAAMPTPEPWIPFDADADEIARLHVIREGIPATLRPMLLGWIHDRLPTNYNWVTPNMIATLQTTLTIDFELPPKGSMGPDQLVAFLNELGDQTVLRVIDLMASWYEPSSPYWYTPSEISDLEFFLDGSSSAFEVYLTDSKNYRLRRRLTEGLEEAAQSAIDLHPDAGRHLANAWKNAFALTPNESFAMTEAIRAVDIASGLVVIPNDKKPTVFKALKVLRDQTGWDLILQNSEGYPNHLDVLVGMLETLAQAQPDRHGGSKPTPLEAQAHVQLAATLVHWFASGAVVRTRA